MLKTGPSFLVFFFQNFPCRKKKEDSSRKTQNNKKITKKTGVKTGPNMWRNLLGPMFNTTLDQFLTPELFCIFWCFLFWGWNHSFYSVFRNILRTAPPQKPSAICEHSCTNCSFRTVLAVHFSCLECLNFQCLESCFLIGRKKSKIQNSIKNKHTKKNKNTRSK